jgi:glycosyltransferase involved in cell wall biosynthesis
LGSAGDVEQNSFAISLVGYLCRKRVDILHVQDALVADVVRKARWLGLVRTCTILGLGSKEPREFQQKFAYLHQLAPWYLEEARLAGAWRPTWTAIPNFVNTEIYHPGAAGELRAELNIPPDARVILCAAAIKRDHKRVDYLLQEFASLRRYHPELPVWLVVAGACEPGTDELVAWGERLLGDRVRFLVQFPRQRMAELYQLADIFVLCSLREMFGIVLLEATASGLPCVVHDHPVLKWVVGPGGQAIDMTAPGALAAALRRHLEDPGLPDTLAHKARQYCVQNFSTQRVVDQILEYYRFVLWHDRIGSRRISNQVPAEPCRQ